MAEDFDDYQRNLLEGYANASSEFDRLVALISTAALSASIAFHDPNQAVGIILLLAWIFLVGALVSSLVSLYVSRGAFARELETYRQGESIDGGPRGGTWGEWADRLTFGTLIASIFGAILLVVSLAST